MLRILQKFAEFQQNKNNLKCGEFHEITDSDSNEDLSIQIRIKITKKIRKNIKIQYPEEKKQGFLNNLKQFLFCKSKNSPNKNVPKGTVFIFQINKQLILAASSKKSKHSEQKQNKIQPDDAQSDTSDDSEVYQRIEELIEEKKQQTPQKASKDNSQTNSCQKIKQMQNEKLQNQTKRIQINENAPVQQQIQQNKAQQDSQNSSSISEISESEEESSKEENIAPNCTENKCSRIDHKWETCPMLTCFHCQQKGHIRRNCPNLI